ncbi:MAG: MATE family efflux transporter, partial [Bacteroidota bacterium]|nr:MATE family efflux transporter [Bacteroidota bacterium]
ILVALGAGIVLIALQLPIEKISFLLISGSPEIESLASGYFYIRIFAAPATISLYAMSGWFLGMQNAKYPMIVAITINLLNVAFNLLFIYGFGMKSEGVAYGTLLAQYAGFFMSVFLLIKKYRHLFHLWNYTLMIKWAALKKFFLVNRDIFIRTLCLMVVFTYFTSKSASTNDITLAVNTMLLQFFFIFSYLIDGFAYAAEALVGKFIGEKNKEGLKSSIKLLFVWGLIISIPFSIVYLLAGNFILMLLTNNQELIKYAGSYILWVAAIPIVSFVSFLWDGIYIGATASRAMRNTMLVATIVVFFPTVLIFAPILGNHSLWLGMILFLAGRGISQTIIAPKAIFPKT